MAKIQGNNSKQVDRRDEQEAKKPEDKRDRKDFKKLLENKSSKKQGDKKRHNHQARPGSASKSLSKKNAQSRRSGEFGERLRDGRQQLGEQGERRARVDTERQTSREDANKRLEGKKHERHWQDVDKGDAKKQEQRARPTGAHSKHAPTKRPSSGAGQRGSDKSGLQAAAGQADRIARLAGDGLANQRAAGGASKADSAAPTQRSEMREQVAQLAEKLVEKARVGEDTAGRRIMLLDLQVPGRGTVRVRLRRRGEGFELRMRPENQELARDLRREREHFRESASEGGVNFTSIEIV